MHYGHSRIYRELGGKTNEADKMKREARLFRKINVIVAIIVYGGMAAFFVWEMLRTV